MAPTHRGALACFAGAAAWPIAMGQLATALMSPLERAMREAWCGAPYHASSEFFGHCAACWIGSAMLAALGMWLLSTTRRAETVRIWK
jgi:hypothetical protein